MLSTAISEVTTTKTIPTRAEAMNAVRTLLAWTGDDPNREGLQDTPKRVVKAFKEFFQGYQKEPKDVLLKTFEEVEGYHDFVLVKDIRFESFCEHHLAPIIGTASIAYLPSRRVVGLSKLARLVDIYAKRLQVQEKMTAQIGMALTNYLETSGVFVLIKAEHQCMTTRGVHKPGSITTTQFVSGLYETDSSLRRELLTHMQ